MFLLGLASLWQAVSGYVDVYSHRFIFTRVDPTLNPAHISLYAASLLGLCVVLVGWRMASNGVDSQRIKPGILLAAVGGFGELLSGLLNEIYHRLYSGTSTLAITHLSIHGLFVASMFIVALGGMLSAILNYGAGDASNRRRALPSVALCLSSVWLLVVGSVAYLGGQFGQSDPLLYLILGSLAASVISVSIFLAVASFGLIVFASFIFFLVNAIVLYSFAGLEFFLPFPILAGSLAELSSRRLEKFGRVRHSLLSGALTGLLSYWLLYQFSFDMMPLTRLFTSAGIFVVVFAGAVGGLLALLISTVGGKKVIRLFH